MHASTTPTIMGKAKRRRRLLFRAAALLIVLLLTEALSWLVIGMVPELEARRTPTIFGEQSARIRELLDTRTPNMIEIHPLLGWRYAAGFENETHHINAQGLRSNRRYSLRPPQGVTRVSAFGDSFVYCSEVNNASAWPTIIEETNPHLEVLNYGVGGYGTDQAFLRFEVDGKPLSPHIVLIGFVPDDIRRTVNVYRRFISNRELPLFKPRYQLAEDGELHLLAAPVVGASGYERILEEPRTVLEFSKHDQWYQPGVYESVLYDYSASARLATQLASRAYRKYFDAERPVRGLVFNVDSSAYRLQVAIMSAFADAARAAGSQPLVVLFPDRQSVERMRRGEPVVYEPLAHDLKRRGVPYVDGLAAFRDASETEPALWFAPHGHYSAEGNRRIAQWLAARLEETRARTAATKIDPVPAVGASTP